MIEKSEVPQIDLKRMFREEFDFSVKMFFAPVMAVVREIKERWEDVDAEVEKITPENH